MDKNKYGGYTALVWDNFLFTHCAIKLAESFGRVLYGGPHVNAFPKSNMALPGDGIDGITRIKDWESYVDEVDLFVFPDVMFGPTQELLVKMGKRVFGSRAGEELELNRWKTKKLLKKLNMPVAESHLIIGMDALRRFIQKRPEHWWIKTSRYRGDFETFDVEGYDEAKTILDVRQAELGEKSRVYPFVVERHIDAIIEAGYDGYNIRGQFPSDDQPCLFGIERKDLGYIGTAKLYGELPGPVRWVNAKLVPYFQETDYCGLYSSEVRCADEDQFADGEPKQFEDFEMIWNRGEKVPETNLWAFLTDPCCRMASPPGEAYIEWLDNWDDIMWHGGAGEFVPPEPNAKYAIEIMLHSSWADKNWQPVGFPEEMTRWIKLRNCCRIDGTYYAVPQSVGLPEIGAVIGLDNYLKTACKLALERSQKVTGYFIEPKVDAIAKTIIEINNAQDQGISFTDEPLPTAEELEELTPAG